MKKLSKIELKNATKLVPTQMRDIQGGRVVTSTAALNSIGFFGAAAAPSNQCCYNGVCEDFDCTNDADCASAYAPQFTCKIISTK